MELLEYSLTSSPVTQTEAIMAAILRVVGGLIQTTKKYEFVESLVSDLQLKIAEKCTGVLEKEEEESARVCNLPTENCVCVSVCVCVCV